MNEEEKSDDKNKDMFKERIRRLISRD
jgi:hypothetical protein